MRIAGHGATERPPAPSRSLRKLHRTWKRRTHGGVADPNQVTGCPGIIGPFFGSSDVDFDGSSYWADWPNGTTPGTFPAPFFQQQPTTNGGAAYPQMQFETDAPASETTCMGTPGLMRQPRRGTPWQAARPAGDRAASGAATRAPRR
jgi:hypothetical protein